MSSQTNSILKPITNRLVTFLTNEMGIKLLSENFEIVHPNRLELYPYTAMIGIGGSVRLMFTLSFEDEALATLTRAFAYGKTSDNEIEQMKESAACEIANIILGNSLPNFPNNGVGVTITPPVMVEHGKSISKNSTSSIATTHITTASGQITLAIITPETLTYEARSPQC